MKLKSTFINLSTAAAVFTFSGCTKPPLEAQKNNTLKKCESVMVGDGKNTRCTNSDAEYTSGISGVIKRGPDGSITLGNVKKYNPKNTKIKPDVTVIESFSPNE